MQNFKKCRTAAAAMAVICQNRQVGGQIVQINNARKDVPYPFTATVSMALNRPFASSSVYVLYADAAAPAAPPQPAPQSPQPP